MSENVNLVKLCGQHDCYFKRNLDTKDCSLAEKNLLNCESGYNENDYEKLNNFGCKMRMCQKSCSQGSLITDSQCFNELLLQDKANDAFNDQISKYCSTTERQTISELTNGDCGAKWSQTNSKQYEKWQNLILSGNITQMITSTQNGIGNNGMDCPLYFSNEYASKYRNITPLESDNLFLLKWCSDNVDLIKQTKSGVYERVKMYIMNITKNGLNRMSELPGKIGKDGVDCPAFLSTEYYKYFNDQVDIDVAQSFVDYCINQDIYKNMIQKNPQIYNRAQSLVQTVSQNGTTPIKQVLGNISPEELNCPVYFSNQFQVYMTQIKLTSDDKKKLAVWCVQNMSSIKKPENLTILPNVQKFFTDASNIGQLDEYIQKICIDNPDIDFCSCTSKGLEYWLGAENVSTDMYQNPVCNFYKCKNVGYMTKQQSDVGNSCSQFDICKSIKNPETVKDQTILDRFKQFCSNITNTTSNPTVDTTTVSPSISSNNNASVSPSVNSNVSPIVNTNNNSSNNSNVSPNVLVNNGGNRSIYLIFFILICVVCYLLIKVVKKKNSVQKNEMSKMK